MKAWTFIAVLSSFPKLILSQDDLGLANGFITFNISNFDVALVGDSQTLASLKVSGQTFDFLPFDYLPRRARNRQHHWGDVTYRYRVEGDSRWVDGDSCGVRQKITSARPEGSTLAVANLAPTIPSDTLLDITREWVDIDGDLGLKFKVTNKATDKAIEIGSLGFPTEFNSIFTGRSAEAVQAQCTLADPYIGLDAGYLQVTPVNGNGPALVVTPLENTPFEGYRNLEEQSYPDTGYRSQTFEGFFEWQVASKVWADQDWKGATQWNDPTSFQLQPGESKTFGFRFSVARDGITSIAQTVRKTDTPVVLGLPGYVLSRDTYGQLLVNSPTPVSEILVSPSGAMTVSEVAPGRYKVTPAQSTFGRVRLTIKYTNNKAQTVHYYITKAATESVQDLGHFLTTAQWYDDASDPFERSPSIITYDYETRQPVLQDTRVWIAGLADEGGAAPYVAASLKQVASPNADEVSKLERFVDETVLTTLTDPNSGVFKSAFYYDRGAMPNYPYMAADWSTWSSWNKQMAKSLDRSYNYVHVTSLYWSLYRVGRAYPELLKSHSWEWYLDRAVRTTIRCFQTDVHYRDVGLMGETIWGELQKDLIREGNQTAADQLDNIMRGRAQHWASIAVPFGSEMAWDSTGQEGVYYWCKKFGFSDTTRKTIGTILGYMPLIPHWGYNGNARRYWDNDIAGKLRRIERQIHHYGSSLNALPLLSEFRSLPTPENLYLLRLAFAGLGGSISNINEEGFGAHSFHSWPDSMKWDGYSSDYGSSFLGLVLGSQVVVVQDPDVGLTAYGGELSQNGGTTIVVPKDAVRRKVFIAPLGLGIEVDAGIIDSLEYSTENGDVKITLASLESVQTSEAILWIESNDAKYTTDLEEKRGGWRVPLDGPRIVTLRRA